MVDRPPLLIATGNAGKLREVQRILDDLPLQLATLAEFDPIPEAVENGRTFAENAAGKAIHYAAHTSCWTLADDSGLVVDALDGAPGVHSARFAGVHGDSAANNTKLVGLLRHVPEPQRTARFVCAIAVASPSGEVLASSTAHWEGRIILSPRGTDGFGYDPHFYLQDRDLTAAELPADTKNRLSHRGQALAAIRAELQRLLAGQA